MVSHYPTAAAKGEESCLPHPQQHLLAPGQPDCSSRGSKCSTVAALGTLGTLPRSNNEEGAAVRLDVSHVPPNPVC